MKPHLVQDKVIVKKSSIQGYGVFAKQDIQAGEIIEECYSLLLPGKEAEINNYLFSAGDDQCALPLGSGCLFNHANQPNAQYYLEIDPKLMIFTANKLIKKGEEIFISYGKDWFDTRCMPIKKISWIRKTGKYLRGFPLRAAFVTTIVFTIIYSSYGVTAITKILSMQ